MSTRLPVLRPGPVVAVLAFGVIAVVLVRQAGATPLQLGLVLLNGLTAAALYFLVASGFTLIFGLMRVTNLAHGAFYLLGGYIGYATYQRTENWWLGLLAAAVAVAIVGVILQRALLPIYGQELREALITLGIGIVISDQILAVWGGQAKDIPVPEFTKGSITIAGDLVFPKYRLFVMVLALLVGAGLWALLRFTRFGMTVRAGVDDRNMVAATGINVLRIFAAVFALGSALAGASGVIGGSFLSLQPGEDTRYLLYSLVVVIVGGLGSVAGAALGALLVGLIENFGALVAPTWSTLITFGLLVVVLAFRPQGLLGRDLPRSPVAAAVPPRGRPIGRAWMVGGSISLATLALAMPLITSDFVLDQLVTKSLWLGVAALSLVFLASTVGMVSLAQTATYGVAGYVVANLTVLHGAQPWFAAAAGLVAGVVFGALVGAVAARSRGTYLLMLTLAVGVLFYYFALQARDLTRGFGGIAPIPAPTVAGIDLGDRLPLYYVCLVAAVGVYAGLRYLQRTPLGVALQGVRDSDQRMLALGFSVIRLRVAAFAIAGLIAGVGGVLAVWYNGQISPGSIDLQRTIDILVIAVIGGLYRFEGAFVGAFVVTLLATFADTVTDRVNTLVGAVFVLVLALSPGGIVGAAGRVRAVLTRTRERPSDPPGVGSDRSPSAHAHSTTHSQEIP